MPLPPGLTDITVHIPTPDEERLANQAAARKDWREYNRWRAGIILHFGRDRVRIPAGKMVIDEIRKVSSRAHEKKAMEAMYNMAIMNPCAEEIRDPKPKPKPKRLGGNLWERIGDDEDWI